VITIAINIKIEISIAIMEDLFFFEVFAFDLCKLLFCESTIISDSKPDSKLINKIELLSIIDVAYFKSYSKDSFTLQYKESILNNFL